MEKDNTKRKTNKGLSKGMYQHIIDNVHRLKSVDITTGIVETANNTNGYVCSSTGYKRVKLGDKTVQVHSILATLKHGEKSIGKQVNHKNGIKTDNRQVNLEIVSQKENIEHQWETGLSTPLSGVKNGNSKLTEEEVRDIRRMHTPGKKQGVGTPKSMSKRYGVSTQTISAIVNRERYKDVM